MKKLNQNSPSPWRTQGQDPDYRFSLANERTYLAWIRTALALLAGAIGIDQLMPDLAEPTIRVLISSFLCVCSGLLSVFAYRRWAQNERAIRNNRQLTYTRFLKVISTVLVAITLVIIWVILS